MELLPLEDLGTGKLHWTSAVMIVGLFKEAVSWFVSLTEVGAVIAAILLIGLVVGMAGFWILGHFIGKLAGPPAELDPYEMDLEEMEGAKVVSIRPDDDSPPSRPTV
jgi:hypothetical protein